MEKAVTKIIIEAQKSSAAHPKLITKLINIYLKSPFENFCSHFFSLMKYPLTHGEKIPVIERTLSFFAKFATSVKSEEQEQSEVEKKSDEEDDDDIDPFLVEIFLFLLKNHEASSKSVRYRVCQLINKILNCMGEQASIDDSLYSKIYDTMLQRLMDKIPAVRVQAILALSRLQDPRNKECPVIKAYLFHLSMDPSPDVRKAVLSNIAITFHTLPDILERRRDKRDFVRRQAYLVLAQKVHIRSFTIAQRVMIISEGLKDRSSIVRQVVKKNILQAWLRLVDGSVLDLLKCLDIEASTDSAELALGSLFEDVPCGSLIENFDLLEDNKLIPFEKLNTESAFYWRCLTKHLRSEKAEDQLDEILPDLSVFCNYLLEYFGRNSPEDEDPQETAVYLMEKEFVCQQLITMTSLFDLSDEVGRKSLCTLVHRLLISTSVGESCIKALSDVFSHLYSPVERVNKLVEIISEIREAPEAETEVVSSSLENTVIEAPKEIVLSEEDRRKNKLLLAQITVKMNQIQEELESCVRNLDLEKAIPLKNTLENLEKEKGNILKAGMPSTPVVPSSQVKMPEEDDEEIKLLTDPATLTRCLLIFCEVLSNSEIKEFGSILRSLHDNLLLPCLKSEDLEVRRFAVRGLALCCLISKELAKQHLLLLIEISRRDVEEIQTEALHGLFDIWLLYGMQGFNSTPDDVKEAENSVGNENKNDSTDVFLDDSQTSAVGNIITLFTEMLENKCSSTRTLVAGGICKLMLASQISSTKLLTHLLLLWYNPDTEDDQLLRHMLGVFFPLYASGGGSNQENLCGALIPTLHTIFKAPARSPLSDIDVEDVISFCTSITNPSVVSINVKSEVNAHNSLVFMVCGEVIANSDRDYTKALVRSLTQMNLTKIDASKLKQINVLARKIIEKVADKSTGNYAEKFYQTIKTLLSNQTEENTEKEDQNVTAQSNDNSETTILSETQQLRRKRTLYNTQTDFELVSDMDSETDRTPSKIKKRDAASSEEDVTMLSEVSSKSSVSDYNEELQEDKNPEQNENELKDYEKADTLGRNGFTVKDDLNESSEDLFAPSQDGESKNKSPLKCPNEDKLDENSSDPSEDIFKNSPLRKSPKSKGGTSDETRQSKCIEKEENSENEDKVSFKGSVLSDQSLTSASFYSARSTSASPELSPPKRRKKSHKTYIDPTDGKNKILDKSIEIKVNKLKTPKISSLRRSSPRFLTGRSTATRSLRTSPGSTTGIGSILKTSGIKNTRSLNRKRRKETSADESSPEIRPNSAEKGGRLSLRTRSTKLLDNESSESLSSTPSNSLKNAKPTPHSSGTTSSSRVKTNSSSVKNLESSESSPSETRRNRRIKVLTPTVAKVISDPQSPPTRRRR
ncbi:Condensin complex subunit 3 [Armadillidium nasatum]|uniref:Condensin complex subunit 3 n=1 Tax=Armadillidium nasatum TaxID=96803 RepID=A0A5N5SW12_9CRUS|nr:Condensin complex subunit 3 [Armadillidium nasatum]